MFNKELYKDIAPYENEAFDEAMVRLSKHPEYIYAFVSSVFKGDELESKRKELVKLIISRLSGVHSYTEFQDKIVAGILLKIVIDKTISSFTVSGVENLDPNKSYLYISNHRDIILDCALLDFALYQHKLPLCQMAIGDNLLHNQFVHDLFKANGAIIVKRELPMKEKYLETIRLSEYFYNTLTSGTSIWIAQKSGRSKDGLDITHPSIIKMLQLGPKKSGLTFSDVMNNINIVPVAISYEEDPNDINKAREEVISKKDGAYTKKPLEDVISMIKGIREYKGHVHVAFGTPISKGYNTPEEVALEVDKQIHSNYRLYANNYFAYDYLNGNQDNIDKWESFDSKAFLSKYLHLSDDVRSFILNSYANPVRSKKNV